MEHRRTYSALIADLRGSRRINSHKREALQLYLLEVVDSLDQLFAESLATDLSMSGGDSIQGLFYSTADAIACARLLQLYIHPLELRSGIGIGEWSTRIPNTDSSNDNSNMYHTNLQDGTSYHHAAHALEAAKENRLGYSVLLYGDDEELNLQVRTINTLMHSLSQILKNQTSIQNELSIAAEMIFALPKNCFNEHRLTQLFSLVQKKEDIMRDCRPKENKNLRINWKELEQRILKCSTCGYDTIKNEFYAVEGSVRGIGGYSETLGVSQQAISQRAKRGHLTEMRNITLVVFENAQYLDTLVRRNFG